MNFQDAIHIAGLHLLGVDGYGQHEAPFKNAERHLQMDEAPDANGDRPLSLMANAALLKSLKRLAMLYSALSDVKKCVRTALQQADVGAPVPVAAPAVAPWQPEPQQPDGGHAQVN